jgi:hypothetical protein
LGDTVGPIIVARGSPDDLLAGGDGPLGLTSETTRRDGIVSDVDVAPTILDFLGVPVPDDMVGSPIEPAGESPSDLHDRYLEFRQVVGPIGTFILWLAIGSLAAGVGVVFVLRRPAPRLARAVGLVMLGSLALFVATAPASVLPSFAWALVIGVSSSSRQRSCAARRGARSESRRRDLAVNGLIWWCRRRLMADPAHAAAWGGVLTESASSASGTHTRASCWRARSRAARLRRAGWPSPPQRRSGASPEPTSAAASPAIAAALWFGIGDGDSTADGPRRPRSLRHGDPRRRGDRVLPGGRRIVPAAAGGGAEAFVDRLAANVRATSANASAWIAVLGLPVWAFVALRRPRRLRPTLDPDPRWRDAGVVLALAGIAGYLLNDTYGSRFGVLLSRRRCCIHAVLARSPESTQARLA